MSANISSPEFMITVLKATNLPYSKTEKPDCCISVVVGSNTKTTQRVKGANPEWNETLTFTAAAGSLIYLRVLHGVRDRIIALAETAVKAEHLKDGATDIMEILPLDLKVSKLGYRQAPSLFLSFSAAPVFSASTLKESLAAQKASAAAGASSQAEPSKSFSHVLKYLQRFVDVVGVITELHPYAKAVGALLRMGQNILQAQYDRNARVRELWKCVLDTIDFMEQAEPLKVIEGLNKTIQAVMEQLRECIVYLTKYGARSALDTVMEAIFPADVDVILTTFTNNFTQLKVNFDQHVNIDYWKTTQHVRQMVESQELRTLPGADLGGIRDASTCLPGTRIKLLDDLLSWVISDSSASMFWLSGAAGTGKSSVAATFAEQLKSMNWLGAFYRFHRDTAGDDAPRYLFGGIAYQLAYFDDDLHKDILLASQDESIRLSRLQAQARSLVVEPLKKNRMQQPLVIIIDALDESGPDIGRNGAPGRAALTQAILEEFPALPPMVKVMVVSRKEGFLLSMLSKYPSLQQEDMSNILNTQADIEKYIGHRCNNMHSSWKPKESDIKSLSGHADQLFVWADVACSYIQYDPPSRMQRLLSDTKLVLKGDLDHLYRHVLLNSLPKNSDDIDITNWHYVVGSIVCLKNPMSIKGMDTLLGIDGVPKKLLNGETVHLSTSQVITSQIMPLLKQDNLAVQLLHKSVFDFLIKQIDKPFSINISLMESLLTIQCLNYMSKHLCYNICKLEDTTLLNSEVDDKEIQVQQYISEPLKYACCYFVQHITSTKEYQRKIIEPLKDFLQTGLLHWIEVMSWLGKIYEAEEMLRNILIVLRLAEENKLIALVDDTLALFKHIGGAMALGACQVYHTGLSLCSKNSALKQIYGDFEGGCTVLSSHCLNTTALRILDGHTDHVTSVAFSYDGSKLVSASYDKTLHLWDAATGAAITIFKGHTDVIQFTVFSPDDSKIASASSDKSVRLWDVSSETTNSQVLQGHTRELYSVAFSPDGSILASASEDKTVQLWNVSTGIAIGLPLEGHPRPVKSVAFSPDGSKLASASEYSIYLWDVLTGAAIGAALEGHESIVNCVIFSPDGSKLASASDDHTLYLWDVSTGAAIGSPFEGHTGLVNSVAFSPDGSRLASASHDETVRLWDVKTATTIGSPLKGHTFIVDSVVFSPDGNKLASASWDKTVRIWDTAQAVDGLATETSEERIIDIIYSPDGATIASRSEMDTVHLWNLSSGTVTSTDIQNYISPITCVVFSPNGSKIATASLDHAVHFWSASTGATFGAALIGHTEQIHTLVFSPNSHQLVSVSYDNTLHLWDAITATAIGLPLLGHNGSGTIHALFSPNGVLASASSDGIVRLWEASTGEAIGPLIKVHTSDVWPILFSPDGSKLASASKDGSVCLWNTSTGLIIGSVMTGHTAKVLDMVFSPNGAILASGSQDSTICLWDTSTTAIIHPAMHLTQMVQSIIFSPDGNRLASLSYDYTICLWNISTGVILESFSYNYLKSWLSICFSPDSNKLALAVGGNTVCLWDVSRDNFTELDSQAVETWMEFSSYYIDSQNFLWSRYLSKRLLWVPFSFRGTIKHSKNPIGVICSDLGSMTFIKPPHLPIL